MKKTVLILFAISIMAVCLSSCSNDDDNNNNSNNTNPTTGTEVENISLKYLKSFCGKTKTVAQDSLTNNGYVFFKEDTANFGIKLYSYIKTNINNDTTIFVLTCYSNYVIVPLFLTTNSDNTKLLTTFKTWSTEMFSWSNQYSNVTYIGTINDSSYSTHNLFTENLNNMDVSLINNCIEEFIISQNNYVTSGFTDKNFNIRDLINIGNKMKSNTKMIVLASVDLSSLMKRAQCNKVYYIIKNIFGVNIKNKLN